MSQLVKEKIINLRLVGKERKRQLLINCTIDSIAKNGLRETTLDKVTKLAGLSLGLVNFHFKSKELLLLETLQYLAEEYSSTWHKALNGAGNDPTKQLIAIINSSFNKKVVSRNKVAVWYAFYSELKFINSYKEVCQKYDNQFVQTTRSLIKEIITKEKRENINADILANVLSNLIDGLWLDLLMTPEKFDHKRAKNVCIIFLSNIFPKQFSKYLK